MEMLIPGNVAYGKKPIAPMLYRERSKGTIPGARGFVLHTKELWDFNKPKGISVCGVHSVTALHRCPEGSTFQV